MSIASEITRLQNDSAAIASAIEAKGVTVPSGSGFDDYATLIGNISGGGGDTFNNWRHDGDTHLWLKIIDDYQTAQTIRIRMIGTIDWGDGSAKETVNVTNYTDFNHTYTNHGRYRIDLHPTSGTFLIGNGSGSYNIMGARNNASMYRQAALYQVEVGRSIITTLQCLAFLRGLLRVYIHKNITTINSGTFQDDYKCESIEFEDATTITSANINQLFQNCQSLQELTPLNISGVTTMSSTYRSASILPVMIMPSSITSISSYSVGGVSMKRFCCLPTTAPTASGTNNFFDIQSVATIEVPFGSLSSYQSASFWSAYASYMVEAGKVTYSLSHVERSNQTPMVSANSSFSTTLTPESGYSLGTVSVKMGGVDITSTAYSDGVVSIPSVTGNIVITASAS